MNEKKNNYKHDPYAEAYMFLMYMIYAAKTREQKEAAIRVWNRLVKEK